MVNRIGYIAVLMLFIFGCKKPEAPDCFQSSGAVMNFPIEISSETQKVFIEDDVKVILRNEEPGQSSYLRCNEFLESDITLEFLEEELHIRNENSCNWVRKAPEIELVLYSNHISQVENKGTKGIELEDYTISSFKFDQWESIAFNSIQINSDSLELNLHTLSGSALLLGSSESVKLYANGSSEIRVSQFTCQEAAVNNSSLRDIYISPSNYLFAFIGGRGNILYNQEGINLSIVTEGSGEVILQDF